MGFSDIIFSNDIYIGQYDPIFSGGSRFCGKGRGGCLYLHFLGFLFAPPLTIFPVATIKIYT